MSIKIIINFRTEQEIKEMIAEEDTDGDGVITKEEFITMLKRKKWIIQLNKFFMTNWRNDKLQ